ncbi:MAG: hypothetical protein RIQ60_1682 [Pseudomonadota bacterium]|jgi:regulatory protein
MAPASASAAALRQRALALLAGREHSRAELARKLAAMPRSARPTTSRRSTSFAECEEFGEDLSAAGVTAQGESEPPDRLDDIEHLLDELEAQGLLSDTRYVASVLHRRAPRLGSARLRQELRAKGVPEEALRDSLADLAASEEARARAVWLRRFGDLPSAGDAKERARQLRFMMARGFSAEIVQRILRGSALEGGTGGGADDGPADEPKDRP